MNQRHKLAQDAAIKALSLRKKLGLQLQQAICIYNIAEEKLGIKVYFDAIPSMEGMYNNGNPPRIFLSSLRPAGRMNYTCAHEIGHHIYNHGMHIDENLEAINNNLNKTEEEFIVECFAGFLLMPKSAVSHGFANRNWDINNCTEEQLYAVAEWLGVGYNTLIDHMTYSIRILGRNRAMELSKIPLKKIKEKILGFEVNDHLIVVDDKWFGRPIDAQVGDLVLFKMKIECEGNCIEYQKENENGQLYRMCAPGIGRCFTEKRDWSNFVRVSRREYVGQCKYRHLEEPIDE